MRNDEFIHILTRVVNSKYGPRFLEAVHALRTILEDAGIAEEMEQKVEPGKPIRQRSPEDISRKPKREYSLEPPAPLPDLPEVSLEIPTLRLEEEAPAAPAEAPPAAAQEAPADEAAAAAPLQEAASAELPEAASPPPEAGEFVEAGPGRLVRKPSAPPPGPFALKLKAPKRESVRSIVLSALEAGDKTMAELQDAVKARKGEISHAYQQIYIALKKIGAQKTEAGLFSISTKTPGEPVGDLPAADLPPPTNGKTGGAGPELPAGAPAPAEGKTRQLNLFDEIPSSREEGSASSAEGDDDPVEAEEDQAVPGGRETQRA